MTLTATSTVLSVFHLVTPPASALGRLSNSKEALCYTVRLKRLELFSGQHYAALRLCLKDDSIRSEAPRARALHISICRKWTHPEKTLKGPSPRGSAITAISGRTHFSTSNHPFLWRRLFLRAVQTAPAFINHWSFSTRIPHMYLPPFQLSRLCIVSMTVKFLVCKQSHLHPITYEQRLCLNHVHLLLVSNMWKPHYSLKKLKSTSGPWLIGNRRKVLTFRSQERLCASSVQMQVPAECRVHPQTSRNLANQTEIWLPATNEIH